MQMAASGSLVKKRRSAPKVSLRDYVRLAATESHMLREEEDTKVR